MGRTKTLTKWGAENLQEKLELPQETIKFVLDWVWADTRKQFGNKGVNSIELSGLAAFKTSAKRMCDMLITSKDKYYHTLQTMKENLFELEKTEPKRVGKRSRADILRIKQRDVEMQQKFDSGELEIDGLTEFRYIVDE